MQVLDSLAQLFRSEAERKVNVVVTPDHVFPPPEDTGPAIAGETYFRLWLVQMFLKNDRDWFKTWYPVVHAVTAFSFGNLQSPVEVAQVAGPSQLKDIDDKHLERTVGQNYALTPLVPFKGGTIQLRAGLVAMQADDAVRRFLDVMGSFAKLVSVPQLSAALAVTDAVSGGVQQLLGISNKQLILGYLDTFVGADASAESNQDGNRPQLKPTYIALINSASGTYAPQQVWVKQRQLLYGQDINVARELTGVDYMLFQLETRLERDDWDQLTHISEPFSKAIDALGQLDPSTGEPKIAEANAFVRTAAVAALNSADLTTRDRMRVVRAIKDRFNSYQETLQDAISHRGEAPAAPTIFDVAKTSRTMSPEQVTLQELFEA